MAAKKNKLGIATGFTRPEWALIDPEMKPIRSGGLKRDYNRLFWEAEYFLHYEVADKSLTAEFIKYAAKHFDKEDAKLLKKLPDHLFSTIGKYTYIANKGGKLTDEKAEKVREYYDDFLEKARNIVEKEEAEKKDQHKEAAPVISIQDRMREQLGNLAGAIEGCLDDFMDGALKLDNFEPYKMIKSYTEADVKAAHAKILRDMFEPGHAEALEVVEWKCEQLKEGYAHLNTATKRKQFVKFYEILFTALDTIINESKAQRKTRVKKAPNKLKLVEKIKYKESESTLGLASINPVSIVGASTLWVFNTKNRKLGVYRADQAGELSVKGTTIQGFDAATSVQKTIRKPEEMLKGADKLARTKLDKMLKEIRATETKLNGRLNEHTLLLKVF